MMETRTVEIMPYFEWTFSFSIFAVQLVQREPRVLIVISSMQCGWFNENK